jgi:hypothetical protein
VLADYGQWIASLIAGLQGRAFDLQIDVFSVVRMPFGKTLDLVRTNVRVKRFGKRSSLKSWGALFSPTGYRMLGFCARMMACSEHGRLCNPGMGASVAPGFDVKLDGRVLTITCNPGASTSRASTWTPSWPGSRSEGPAALVTADIPTHNEGRTRWTRF